jgi:acyl carrier protein
MVSAKTEAAASPAIPVNDAINALGRHFAPDVCEAYARFEAKRDPADADIVVIAIVLDHIPDKKNRPAQAPADTVALMADLGFDSVAITEMVFFLEDLFAMRISNDEILRVQTVGDLRTFVRQKLVGQPPVDDPRCA